MINTNYLPVALSAFLTLKLLTELCLDFLNYNHLNKLKGPIPKSWKRIFDQQSFDKTICYSLSKAQFSAIDLIYNAALLMIILLSNILPWLFYGLQAKLGTSLSAQAFIFLVITLVLSIPHLPLEWWSQFKLEEKYGFNRSTLKLWISDKIKGIILSIALGFPLIWLLLRFYQSNPHSWWIWGFAAVMAFQITLQLLYPWLILPLFNKRMPLEDGELKEQLLKLAKKANFSAKTIQVIDGSKRSSHSNAFFSGFGKFRCIILFDTLIDQLASKEIEAVLAHEIGHYKKGHIPKRLILSAIIGFISFKLIDWVLHQSWIFSHFGFSPESGVVPILILFSLAGGILFFWVSPLLNAWSRHHEYEADAFAQNLQGTPSYLISGLEKLYKENLSNLDPHPAYSTFYYSHPTLLERANALQG